MAQVTQDAKQAAKAVANAPTNIVVAGIDTVQSALDAVRSLLDSGETSADQILDTVKAEAPTLVEPVLALLHLSTKSGPAA